MKQLYQLSEVELELLRCLAIGILPFKSKL